MTRIFISYRRSDTSAAAAALHERLTVALPHAEVFRDVESLVPAADWRKAILHAVQSADWFIALLGPGWVDERLTDRSDLVRIEISTALRRRTPTLPVLIDGAAMPAAERLPLDVAMLTRLQATRISPSTFEADCARIAQVVDTVRMPPFRPPMPAGLVGLWTRTTATAGAFYEFFADGTYVHMTVLQQRRFAGMYKFEYWEEGILDTGDDAVILEPIRASASQSDPDDPDADYANRPREIATRTMTVRLSTDARALTLIEPGEAPQTFLREMADSASAQT